MKLTKIKASYVTGVDDDWNINIIHELEDGRIINRSDFNSDYTELKEIQDEIDRINSKHKE